VRIPKIVDIPVSVGVRSTKYKCGCKAFACRSIQNIYSLALLGYDVENQSWTIRICPLNFCCMELLINEANINCRGYTCCKNTHLVIIEFWNNVDWVCDFDLVIDTRHSHPTWMSLIYTSNLNPFFHCLVLLVTVTIFSCFVFSFSLKLLLSKYYSELN